MLRSTFWFMFVCIVPLAVSIMITELFPLHWFLGLFPACGLTLFGMFKLFDSLGV
jgi:hypothetical protein